MAKKLNRWNGRATDWAINNKKVQRIYIGAFSRADASRALKEAGYLYGTDSELKNYFSECWGNSMDGINLDRGVWVSFSGHSSKEVIERIL